MDLTDGQKKAVRFQDGGCLVLGIILFAVFFMPGLILKLSSFWVWHIQVVFHVVLLLLAFSILCFRVFPYRPKGSQHTYYYRGGCAIVWGMVLLAYAMWTLFHLFSSSIGQ